MTLEKRIGLGFKLGVDKTGGTTFTDIASIVDGFDGPGADWEMADVTLLADTFKKQRKAQGDGGEVTYTVAYDPTHAVSQLLGDIYRDTTSVPNWQITFPDQGASTNQKESFKAHLKGFKRKTQKKTLVVADITLAVDGDPGIAATPVTP